ncbi:hypothetical protein ESCOMMO157M_23615 [Escherichia coli]
MRGMSWLCLLDLRQLDHEAGFADIAAGGRENGDQDAIPLPEVYTYVFRIPGYDSHPIHTDRESRIFTDRQRAGLHSCDQRTIFLPDAIGPQIRQRLVI